MEGTAREKAINVGLEALKTPEKFRARLKYAKETASHHMHSSGVAVMGMWGFNGMQSVHMDQSYAAALMVTDVPIELAPQIKLPWPCFEIVVGDELIPGVESCLVCELEGLIFVVTCLKYDGAISAYYKDVNVWIEKMDQVPCDDDSISSGRMSQERIRRLQVLTGRLAINTCLDIAAHHSERVATTPRLPKRNLVRFMKQPRGFAIGKPLNINCLSEVRDYAEGVSRKLGHATLVRGHWRDQPHGPQKVLRKIIWIMPHFRGGGPLLVRPVILGDKPDEKS